MKHPFLFAQKERKGLYTLIFLATLFIASKFYFYSAPVVLSSNDTVAVGKKTEFRPKSYRVPIHQFDPNTLRSDEWIAMGLEEKIAHRIIKYLSKGGRFDKAADLRKMYGMDSLFCNLMENKIDIQNKEKQLLNGNHKRKDTLYSPRKFAPRVFTARSLLELNAANEMQLIEVRGIGPTLAARILKYRQVSRGFLRKEELRKVFGIDSEAYVLIAPQVTVDANLVRTLKLNSATVEELSAFWCIGKKRAKAIVAFREQHGDFSSPKDLLKTQVINDSILYLIEPYILLHDR